MKTLAELKIELLAAQAMHEDASTKLTTVYGNYKKAVPTRAFRLRVKTIKMTLLKYLFRDDYQWQQ